MNKFLLYGYLLFMVISCKKSEEISFKEIAYPNQENIVSINISEAIGNSKLANVINSEIMKLITASLHVGDPDNIPNRTLEENISFFNAEFNQFKTVFPESTLQWEAQIDGEVIYQSDEIISIALTSYINTGGAHGNSTISLLNFDCTKALLLNNNQLFNNIIKIKTLANQYFEKEVEDDSQYFFENGFTLPANIGYSDKGIIFLYNTYEIAPYSKGITEFTIPFKDISSYLNYQ